MLSINENAYFTKQDRNEVIAEKNLLCFTLDEGFENYCHQSNKE